MKLLLKIKNGTPPMRKVGNELWVFTLGDKTNCLLQDQHPALSLNVTAV